MKLNKNKWQERCFSDLTQCIEDHEKDPLNNGYTYFIGLDDINSENAQIQKTGLIENGTTFTKTFQSGDILFGKRRPYLRKVAVANLKGLCSSDILVFRPKKEIIEPDLLFLYVYSDKFISHAIRTSAGSLSPRTKWKDLAKFKVLLPTNEEQIYIASLFENIKVILENIENQEHNLKKLKKNFLNILFRGVNKSNTVSINYEKRYFHELAFQISERVEPKNTNLKVYVGLEHLDTDNLSIDRTGTPDDVVGTKLKIYKGNIIFGKRRAYQRKVAVSHFDGIASAHSMILRANEEKVERSFLPYFMQSDVFMERAVQISEGSLSPTIKWKTLASQEFWLPAKNKQKELVKPLIKLDNILNQLRTQKQTLRKLKQNLLNEIVG